MRNTHGKEENEMINTLRRFFVVSMALVLALVGSGLIQPSLSAQAAAVLPGMYATIWSGGSSYNSTVYTGKQLTLQVKVQNVGNVGLGITATMATPLAGPWTRNMIIAAPWWSAATARSHGCSPRKPLDRPM